MAPSDSAAVSGATRRGRSRTGTAFVVVLTFVVGLAGGSRVAFLRPAIAQPIAVLLRPRRGMETRPFAAPLSGTTVEDRGRPTQAKQLRGRQVRRSVPRRRRR